jgi:hypothetical protein
MASVEFSKINKLQIGNIVQYNTDVYSIYDMDEMGLIYLNNPDLKSIGIPESKIKPVVIIDHVMDACNFKLLAQPEKIFVGDKLIQVRTTYTLLENKWGIDFKVCIVTDYNEEDPFLVRTFDKIDKGEEKVKYLHQVQNIFKHFFNFELVTLE